MKSDSQQDFKAVQNSELAPEFCPKHDGPASHKELMEIGRAIMKKRHAVLAALAKS